MFCAKLCDCWRSNVEFQTHVNPFAICTFCRRCDICSWEELMSYAVLPSLWGLAFKLERPFTVDQFLGRAFRITQVCGWGCRWSWFSLPLVPNERRGLLLLQLADASFGHLQWGVLLLLPFHYSIRPKRKQMRNLEAINAAYRGSWNFCFSQVQNAGFSSPTPIQAQSWPVALQSRDIVAIAKTGSGKTLGYLLPGFIHVKRTRNDPQMGPTVLVLSPTRELATQIQNEAVKFGKSSRLSCVVLHLVP